PSLSCDTCPDSHTIVPPAVLMPWTYRTGLYTVGAQKASFCMDHLLNGSINALLPSLNPSRREREIGIPLSLVERWRTAIIRAKLLRLGFDNPLGGQTHRNLPVQAVENLAPSLIVGGALGQCIRDAHARIDKRQVAVEIWAAQLDMAQVAQ